MKAIYVIVTKIHGGIINQAQSQSFDYYPSEPEIKAYRQELQESLTTMDKQYSPAIRSNRTIGYSKVEKRYVE